MCLSNRLGFPTLTLFYFILFFAVCSCCIISTQLWPKKDKLDQAKADIQACVQADPNNREARSLLVDLKDKYRQMAEEQKRELSGFLSRQR